MDTLKNDLAEFTSRMQQAAGADVAAIILYGSAARDDFHERYSDVNLLCVLERSEPRTLDAVAGVVQWWTRTLHHRPPQVLTLYELRTSADVFAIETLDLKHTHHLLAGRDVLTAIEVPMNLHRLQLEHELRTQVLKLRQHYLLFAGSDKELETAVAKAVSSTVVLLRHFLIAAGQDAPARKRDVVAHAAQLAGANAAAIDAALDLREGRRIELRIDELYHRYMEFVSSIVTAVDKLAPKRQWQRVAAPQEGTR